MTVDLRKTWGGKKGCKERKNKGIWWHINEKGGSPKERMERGELEAVGEYEASNTLLRGRTKN